MSTKAQLSPGDLYRLRVISDVRLSPDGKHAAITISFADKEKDEHRSFIALVDVNSGTLRAVTDADKKSWSPEFSPDATRLAFLSNRSG